MFPVNNFYYFAFLSYEVKCELLFISPVDQILESKKAGTDTEGLESEVDTLVYWLYDLTDDEIAIVEGKDSMKEIILIH
ncbi:MAG: hypothetical protein H0V31_04260 [Acidobacteria bacterium]|nr:hypothetical protein [Acidobacteriota bacterium]